MSTSIKVIKFTSILSIIFLVITYLITVNIESRFISLNTIWISNNFLLTVFGGVFASTLVVLFCEINKYLIDKKRIINDDCNNRYNWNKIREMTQNSYISLFEINKK